NRPNGLWAALQEAPTIPTRQSPTARRSGPASWGDPPMHRRPLRRATVLAIAAVLVLAGTAFADQLLADGDLVNSGIQGTKALGTVAPGAEVTTDVEFTLNCVGLGHVDVGQTVNIGWSGVGSVPTDGAIVSVTPATIGPMGDGWAADTQGCPDP